MLRAYPSSTSTYGRTRLPARTRRTSGGSSRPVASRHSAHTGTWIAAPRPATVAVTTEPPWTAACPWKGLRAQCCGAAAPSTGVPERTWDSHVRTRWASCASRVTRAATSMGGRTESTASGVHAVLSRRPLGASRDPSSGSGPLSSGTSRARMRSCRVRCASMSSASAAAWSSAASDRASCGSTAANVRSSSRGRRSSTSGGMGVGVRAARAARSRSSDSVARRPKNQASPTPPTAATVMAVSTSAPPGSCVSRYCVMSPRSGPVPA